MSSISVYIVVEGQTEQTFVRDILAPQMANHGIYLHPSLIGKPGHKGGCVRFDRAKNDIGNFLKQRPDIYVSTMLDYSGIDSEWPGKADVIQRIQDGGCVTAIQKAEIIEAATLEEIIEAFANCTAGSRFVPYIEMHEFEALLFSDADILADMIEIDISKIQQTIYMYNNPEEINDDPAQAPSKRLEVLRNGYRKVADGKSIAEAIGIQAIRNQCPHFNTWLTKLEQLKEECN